MTKWKEIMKKAVLVMPLLFLIGFTASYMAGCAGTPNRVAYQVSGTTRVTVQEGLKFWNDQFVKTGKATVAQEQAVKNVYEKVQNSARVVCDAGKALSAASVDGATPTAQLLAAFEQATSDFTADRLDFINMLTSFGVKLP
jgi:hypothetical protein